MGGIRIVFDGPPDAESGRFVEAEDRSGRSVDAGEWHERDDGLWELRLHEARLIHQLATALAVVSSVTLVVCLTLYFGLG